MDKLLLATQTGTVVIVVQNIGKVSVYIFWLKSMDFDRLLKEGRNTSTDLQQNVRKICFHLWLANWLKSQFLEYVFFSFALHFQIILSLLPGNITMLLNAVSTTDCFVFPSTKDFSFLFKTFSVLLPVLLG